MTATTNLGQHLRVLRKQRGITVEELAKRLKVSPGTVSSWELGYRDLPVGRLVAYTKAIGAHIRIALEDG